MFENTKGVIIIRIVIRRRIGQKKNDKKKSMVYKTMHKNKRLKIMSRKVRYEIGKRKEKKVQ